MTEEANNITKKLEDARVVILSGFEKVHVPDDKKLTYNAGILVPYHGNKGIEIAFYWTRFAPYLSLNTAGKVCGTGFNCITAEYLISFVNFTGKEEQMERFLSLIDEQLGRVNKSLQDTAIIIDSLTGPLERLLSTLEVQDEKKKDKSKDKFYDVKLKEYTPPQYAEVLGQQETCFLENMQENLTNKVETDAHKFRNRIRKWLKKTILKKNQRAYCCLGNDSLYRQVNLRRPFDLAYRGLPVK